MTRPCGARSRLCRGLRVTAVIAAMVLAGAAALAGRHLTPPPTLSSIPPRPAAPDSYAARVVAMLPPAAPVTRAAQVAPDQASPRTLRVWGPPAMRAVVEHWASGFHRLHPELTVEPRLMGSDTAVPGLYAGLSDTAPSDAVRSDAVPSDYALEVAASLPAYDPQERVKGTIRLWGHGSPKHHFLARLLQRWEQDFHRYQPGVRIVDDLYGSASGVGALYTGAGDLAILGEEVSPAARRAFERERHYPPTVFEVATGSVDVNYYDYAHMVFVNRANPLDRMTMPQLARILGSPARGSGSGPIRTWGELGLKGSRADRRIQPYSWRFDQDFGLFLRARVLGGGVPPNPTVREFVTYERPDGSTDDRGEQILRALARDPAGIAISNLRFANPSVKMLSLAATSAGPYVLPSAETLISQQYPLTRIIPAVIDLRPGQPIDPAIREFLRFILSRDGQRALVEDSGYLPLGPQYVRAQLQKLHELSRCRAPRGCRSASQQPVLTTLQKQELASGPGHPLDGVIRVWGNPGFRALARAGAKRFRARHPRDRVDLHMTGSDTGMAGLYTGEADVALLGRPAGDSELQAFQWVFRRPPSCVEMAAAGGGVSGKTPRNRSLYVYLDSGKGAQPLAPVFLHDMLSQSGGSGQPCASTR